MSVMFPTPEQEKQMVADAESVERFARPNSLVSDLGCHVKALLAEVHRLRGVLQEIAAFSGDDGTLPTNGHSYERGYRNGKRDTAKIARKGLE